MHIYFSIHELFDSYLQPAGPGDVYKYQKVEKTDMPSENDYACPRSQYPWGCVHTVKSLSEAFIRCNGDPQCRAIVVLPSKIKLGLFLALLLQQFIQICFGATRFILSVTAVVTKTIFHCLW